MIDERYPVDRVMVQAAADDLLRGIGSQDRIEPGPDDPRSPAQIRRDAEKNGGNPRMPILDKGLGVVSGRTINITPVPEHRPE